MQPTDTFLEKVADISAMLGPAKEKFVALLVAALKKLRRYEWDESLPIKPHGFIGDSFIYDFSDSFSFTFRVLTDQDEEGTRITVHYYMKDLLAKH